MIYCKTCDAKFNMKNYRQDPFPKEETKKHAEKTGHKVFTNNPKRVEK